MHKFAERICQKCLFYNGFKHLNAGVIWRAKENAKLRE